MSIPTLTNVDQWPTRKLPQSTFDTSVRTSMNQMSTMVSELNSGVIPGINVASDAAVSSAATAATAATTATTKAGEAATSATSAAASATTATTQASAASTSAANAANSATAAAGSATAAAASATSAAESAAAAAAITGLPTIASGDGGKAIVVKPDASGWELAEIESGANAGGATKLTISADLTLTADSPRKMALSASASGLRVVLPDPATITQDGVSFIVTNVGDSRILVTDSTGEQFGEGVATGKASAFVLVNATTNSWAAFEAEVSDGAGTYVKPYSATVFESLAINYLKLISLSSNKFLAVYGNNGGGFARVLTINGQSVDVGNKCTFNAGNTAYISAAKISDTSVLVSYTDVANSYYGTSQVLTVSDSNVVFGEKLIFSSASTGVTSCSIVSSTRVVVSFVNSGASNVGQTSLLGIEGNTLTLLQGNVTFFPSSSVSSVSSIALSATTALVMYTTSTTAGAIVATINNTAISFGNLRGLWGEGASYISGVAVSTSQVLFACITGTSQNSRAIVGLVSVNGDLVKMSSSAFYSLGPSSSPALSKLSDTRYIATCLEDMILRRMKANIVIVEGSTLRLGKDNIVLDQQYGSPTIASTSSGTALVAYSDSSNGSYGTAKVVSIS